MRTGLWRLDALDRWILVIAVPALGSLLVEPVHVLTDTAVVGRLGTTEVGGLALASTVLNTLVWVCNFLSYGTTVRVAVRRGRSDLQGGARDALQAMWLAVGIGIAVAGLIALAAALSVFVLVMVRPSLGLLTVWLGMLLWSCVLALRNHRRVQGEAWLAGAERVT